MCQKWLDGLNTPGSGNSFYHESPKDMTKFVDNLAKNSLLRGLVLDYILSLLILDFNAFFFCVYLNCRLGSNGCLEDIFGILTEIQ